MVIGATFTSLVVVASLGAPFLTGYDPTSIDPQAILQPPNSAHLFGTDDFGHDLLSRVLYGGRISILVGVLVAGATTILGLAIGSMVGYFQRLDNPIMRVMDGLMAFPSILLAIGIMAVLGPRLSNIVIALTIVCTPRSVRVVRGTMLGLKHRDFVEGARALGAGDARIILRHLIPNCIAPLLVQQTYTLAVAILSESGLDFLGVGVPPGTPTLGGILSDAETYLETAPWIAISAGVAISLLVLGVNLLGDGVRDLLDPRLRRIM